MTFCDALTKAARASDCCSSIDYFSFSPGAARHKSNLRANGTCKWIEMGVWKRVEIQVGRKGREKDFNLASAVYCWNRSVFLCEMSCPARDVLFCSSALMPNSYKLLLLKKKREKTCAGWHCDVPFACLDVSRSPWIWFLNNSGFVSTLRCQVGLDLNRSLIFLFQICNSKFQADRVIKQPLMRLATKLFFRFNLSLPTLTSVNWKKSAINSEELNRQ